MLPSYYEALHPLPDEQRLKMYDAIFDFAFAGREPEGLEPILNGYFLLLKPNIQSSIRHYKCSVENGEKGGRPSNGNKPGKNPEETQEKPSRNPAETQEKPSGNREKDMDMEKDMEKHSRSRFVPPTLEEVAAYVQERGSNVDPQGFIDFYTANGWMVGKNPMKDWKAACRNAERWERWSGPKKNGLPDYSCREDESL